MEVFGKIMVVKAKPLGTVKTMNAMAMNIAKAAKATKEMKIVLIPDVCIIMTRLEVPTKDGKMEVFGRMMVVKTVKTMSAAMNIAKAMMATRELKIVRIPDVCIIMTHLEMATKDGKMEVIGKMMVVKAKPLKAVKTMNAAMNIAKAMKATKEMQVVLVSDVCMNVTHLGMTTKDGRMEVLGKMMVVKAEPTVKTMNAMNIAQSMKATKELKIVLDG